VILEAQMAADPGFLRRLEVLSWPEALLDFNSPADLAARLAAGLISGRGG
jgi:hypothetical protein